MEDAHLATRATGRRYAPASHLDASDLEKPLSDGTFPSGRQLIQMHVTAGAVNVLPHFRPANRLYRRCSRECIHRSLNRGKAGVSQDVSRILGEWPYDPDNISVRIVRGEDGRDKVQLRLDLGLLEMEVEGRPDGQRPEGCESWLECYERRQREHDASGPDGPPFELESEDCAELLREGIQYYHRYLSFWHLGRYDLCARDTERNLRLFAFVREFASDDRDKLQLDQWRPYVTMMHTRSIATPLVEQKDFSGALAAIQTGIEAIHRFLEEYGQTDRADQCNELSQLEHWKKEIVGKESEARPGEPEDRVSQLRRMLDEAVAHERYEEAARLRDEIQRLGPSSPAGRRASD